MQRPRDGVERPGYTKTCAPLLAIANAISGNRTSKQMPTPSRPTAVSTTVRDSPCVSVSLSLKEISPGMSRSNRCVFRCLATSDPSPEKTQHVLYSAPVVAHRSGMDPPTRTTPASFAALESMATEGEADSESGSDSDSGAVQSSTDATTSAYAGSSRWRRAVPHLGEDDERGAVAGGVEDGLARACDVRGFVRADGELAEGHLDAARGRGGGAVGGGHPSGGDAAREGVGGGRGGGGDDRTAARRAVGPVQTRGDPVQTLGHGHLRQRAREGREGEPPRRDGERRGLAWCRRACPRELDGDDVSGTRVAPRTIRRCVTASRPMEAANAAAANVWLIVPSNQRRAPARRRYARATRAELIVSLSCESLGSSSERGAVRL